MDNANAIKQQDLLKRGHNLYVAASHMLEPMALHSPEWKARWGRLQVAVAEYEGAELRVPWYSLLTKEQKDSLPDYLKPTGEPVSVSKFQRDYDAEQRSKAMEPKFNREEEDEL